MVTMGRVAAQAVTVFMARAAVQIPIFKILKATKVGITNKSVQGGQQEQQGGYQSNPK